MILLIFSIAAIKMRRSQFWLFIYLILLFVEDIALVILTLIFHFDVDKLVDLAYIAYKDKFSDKTQQQIEQILKSHFNIVQYVLTGFIGVLFLTWFFGFCYRWSINRNTDDKHFEHEKDVRKEK